MDFATWQATILSPPWLRKKWGALLETFLGTYKDYLAATAKDAVKCAMPASAPSDALPYVGAARNLERYSADTDSTFRARLLDPWALWEFAATSTGLLARLADQGFTDAYIETERDRAPDVPPQYLGWWSAFWIVIPSAHGFTLDTWGSGTWGDVSPGPPPGPGTWGTDATLYQINELRGSIRKWKAAEEICAGIQIVLSGDAWTNRTPWTEGTWGGAVVTWPV